MFTSAGSHFFSSQQLPGKKKAHVFTRRQHVACIRPSLFLTVSHHQQQQASVKITDIDFLTSGNGNSHTHTMPAGHVIVID